MAGKNVVETNDGQNNAGFSMSKKGAEVPKFPVFKNGHDVYVTSGELALLTVDRAEPDDFNWYKATKYRTNQ